MIILKRNLKEIYEILKSVFCNIFYKYIYIYRKIPWISLVIRIYQLPIIKIIKCWGYWVNVYRFN